MALNPVAPFHVDTALTRHRGALVRAWYRARRRVRRAWFWFHNGQWLVRVNGRLVDERYPFDYGPLVVNQKCGRLIRIDGQRIVRQYREAEALFDRAIESSDAHIAALAALYSDVSAAFSLKRAEDG